MKLFKLSESKVEKNMDLLTIMQNMQKFKVTLKNSLMTKEIIYNMIHSDKFLINLDDSSSDDSISDSNELDEPDEKVEKVTDDPNQGSDAM